MKEHFNYIDTTKGILIMLVVLGHVLGDCLLKNFIYAFHMPAFFLISGYLLKKSSDRNERTLSYFILHKIKTILVPYFVFEAICLLIDNIGNGFYMNVNGFIFTCIYDCVTDNCKNYVDWFLLALFAAQLMLFLLIRYTNKLVIKLSLVTIIFMTLFFRAEKITPILYASIFLIIGYLIWAKLVFNKWYVLILCFTVIILVAGFNGQISIAGGKVNNVLLFYAGSFAGTYLSVFVGKLFEQSKILQFLGKNSLYLMGVHVPVLYVFPSLFHIHIIEPLKQFIIFLIIMTISVIITLAYIAIKKYIGIVYKRIISIIELPII